MAGLTDDDIDAIVTDVVALAKNADCRYVSSGRSHFLAIGYDSPGGLDEGVAAFKRLFEQGVPALVRDVRRLKGELAEHATLKADVVKLRGILAGMAGRIVDQSELLTRLAERAIRADSDGPPPLNSST